MQLGLALPQFGPLSDAGRVADFARSAELMGYRSLWVGDRLLTPLRPNDPYPGVPQPYPPEFTRALDPIVVLAAAASATTSARLGSSTLNAPWYNAVLLGRALTSLDVLSGGRLDVGVGLGWMRDEYAASGVDYPSRGRRLEETLDVWRSMWSEDPVEHHGEFFDVAASVMDVRPQQQGGPPVLLGGASFGAMERVGRRGAGWLGLPGLPADFETALWDAARRAAEAAGRDPEGLRRVLRLNPPAGTRAGGVADGVLAAASGGLEEVFVDLSYCTRDVDEALEVAAALVDRVGAPNAPGPLGVLGPPTRRAGRPAPGR